MKKVLEVLLWKVRSSKFYSIFSAWVLDEINNQKLYINNINSFCGNISTGH